MKAATFKCNRRRRRQRRALSLKVVTYWNREKEEIALHCKPITISRHKRNRLPTYLPIVTQRGKLRAMLSHTMFSTLDQLSIKSFSKHLFDHREREGHGEVGVTNVTRLSLHRKEKEDEEEVTANGFAGLVTRSLGPLVQSLLKQSFATSHTFPIYRFSHDFSSKAYQ